MMVAPLRSLSEASKAFSINSSKFSCFNAEISMTGTPSLLSNAFASIVSPFFLTTSLIFKATTTGTSISSNCVVKYKFLSKFVASTMLITQSGFSSKT